MLSSTMYVSEQPESSLGFVVRIVNVRTQSFVLGIPPVLPEAGERKPVSVAHCDRIRLLAFAGRLPS